jgi:UDP-N-acetylglucosamine--N-acetylmuramyl-(pentapeptide) pyrophosphoryl-undecaprenol N-acetylglucosamine transferase
MKVVIAAGGTAGHVVPALAVAGALQAEGAEVVFVGGERAEAELVPAAGFELRPIRVRGLSRTNPLAALSAAGLAVRAVGAASRILREERADVVLGGGGYVAGPVGAAAVARRVPLVLTEADSHLGIANRLLAPFARRVALAFPLEGRTSSTYLVTGRPVPAPATDRGAARARFGIGLEDRVVLIFGGSLGARSINEAAVAAFGDGDPGYRVLHAAGRRDHDALVDRVPGPFYDLEPYIYDFGEALLASDLVVARAGGSIFEVAAAGRPAILVPYPSATGDHQTANARWMERAGAAIVVRDDELTPERLRAEVDGLMGDPARLEAMSAASAALARPDAAEAIAREVWAAAGDPRDGGAA